MEEEKFEPRRAGPAYQRACGNPTSRCTRAEASSRHLFFLAPNQVLNVSQYKPYAWSRSRVLNSIRLNLHEFNNVLVMPPPLHLQATTRCTKDLNGCLPCNEPCLRRQDAQPLRA